MWQVHLKIQVVLRNMCGYFIGLDKLFRHNLRRISLQRIENNSENNRQYLPISRCGPISTHGQLTQYMVIKWCVVDNSETHTFTFDKHI